MIELRETEKLLKRYLKKRKSITLALVISFLISGVPYVNEETVARDLRARTKENNNIRPEPNGPAKSQSANGTDVIDIVNPNSNGLSHNKFIDFNVGAGNGVIFNNNGSQEHVVSKTGGLVFKNKNLKTEAKTILTEVTGTSGSNINGTVEIAGKKADFILANENGININGASFINTNGVTLTTGKVSTNNDNIHFNVQKGNIYLNGVGTSGGYFNVLAKTIELHKEVAPLDKEQNPDITFIAGENKLSAKTNDLKNIKILESKKAESNKYGIYASQLGAMYGRNIRLISTDSGLGVRHEGIILSEKDIDIDSNGDIYLNTVNSQGNFTVKGKNLTTGNGTVKIGDKEYINSISAKGDIDFNMSKNINLNSAVQSTGGNIKVVAENLVLSDKTSARLLSEKSITLKLSNKLDVQGVMVPAVQGVKSENLVIVTGKNGELQAKDITTGKIYSNSEVSWVSTGIIGKDVEIFAGELVNSGLISANKTLKIDGDKIFNEKSGVIKGADLNLKAKTSFVNKGDIRENRKDLNEFVDPNGKLKIEVTLGTFENYGNISSKKIELLTQKLINALTGKIIASDGDIVITTSVGDLINNGEIFSDKDVHLISKGNITNTGKIGGDNLEIQAVQGQFLNAGNISSVKDLSIIVNSLVNAGSKEEIKEYLSQFYDYSEAELKKVNEIVEELNKKIAEEKDSSKLNALKESLSYFKDVQESLVKLKEEFSKTGELGNISAKNIKIEGTGDIKNKGIISSSNNLDITGKNIENKGTLQAENDMFLKAIESITNAGRMTANKNIKINAKSFISEGNGKLLAEYLENLKKFDENQMEKVSNEIAELEKQLKQETNTQKVSELKNKLKTLKDKLKEFNEIKSKISSFEGLGVIEGDNIVITTVDSLKNNGILISQSDVELKSLGDIFNNGTMSVGKNLTIEGKNFTSENLTVGEKLTAKVREIFSSKDLTVGNEIDVQGNLVTKGNLTTNKGLKISGDLKTETGSKTSVKSDITIGGSADLNGILSANGNLTATNKDKNFSNKGEMEISGDANINSKNMTSNDAVIGGKLNINISDKITNTGDLQVKGNVDLKGNSFENIGKVNTEGDVSADITGKFSSNELSTKGNLNIKSNDFENINKITVGKNISINAGTGNISSNVIHSEGQLDMSGKNIEIKKEIISSEVKLKGNLNNTGSIQSKGDLSIESKDNITVNSGGKLVSVGDINLKTEGTLTNKGMVVSNKNIDINADSIKNDKGTVWASKDVTLKADEKIHNYLGTIESKENMTLTAKEVTNEAGTIKAGKNLNINTNSLINKSVVVQDIKIEGYKDYQTVTKWNDTFNYHLDYVDIKIPNVVDNSYVKDKASISSGGDLTVKGFEQDGKTDIQNISGTIASSKNINIYGNVTNTSHKQNISLDWFLENIHVKLHWETRLYLTNAFGKSGITFEGSLKDALYKGYFGRDKEAYYQSLAQHNVPLLNQILGTLLGPDWKGQNKPKPQEQWNKASYFEYVAANAGGKILAGNDLKHEGGFFNNNGGESGGNQNVKVSVGEESVNGIISNGTVNIGDINQIKEVDGVKQLHDVKIQIGEVTLNGVIIKAETGNTAGSIAVAGTINPIVFIETPKGENGIFKPASPKPDGMQPMYETNIEFIDPNKYYGSDYFFQQIGYDKNKTGSVIGDAYYEYMLISKMIKEGLGYTGELTIDNMKALLDNALQLQGSLGLEIGKPLTPEQVNKLDKDIIWYIEVEVNGQKTLTPQIYFSNDSRVNIANGQGSGGNSIVKAGGNIITDNTSFNNTNGNITADGNIIIKSQGDINNNSYGGVGGGITSNNGNIALDSDKDVNIIGGSVKGDNVLLSGNDINIESTLGTDKDGNQKISDQAGIEGNNGIQLDAKNDVNIKGGNLVANGTEIKPEEKEESGGAMEVAPEEKQVKKDVKYYEELFKKDSADIIEGDAGSINISAKGDVNIEDIYTTSSSTKHTQENGNHKTDVSVEAKSNGSKILGSNINIKSDKDVNIKGSSLGTNDLLEKNKDKNLKSGSINLDAKNDVNITDSQDVSYKKTESHSTSMEQGLLTTKWGTQEKNQSLSKGSSLMTGGDVNISSGNDIKLQGSNVGAKNDVNLSAKNDVNILDGRKEIKETSSEGRYQVLGGGITESEKKSSLSQGSGITTGGDLNVESGNNIKIVNGELSSSGDVNLNAKNDISIEAGKNEYYEKTTSTNVGIYVDGSAGIGGIGVTGNASTSDMKAEGEISSEWGGSEEIQGNLDGSNEKTPTISGKPHMDQLVNSEIGLKAEHKKTELDETTWSESQLQGNNININAGNRVDIGGGDYKAEKDINITGKIVDSTKYEDKKTEKNSGFSVGVKQAQGVNSSIADTINMGTKMDQAIKSGQANTGVLVAQGVGAASNLLFNDMAGVFSKQSVNASIENSTKTETSENITSLDGKNINIKATEGDINLNGVEIKGEDSVSLDAKKDINISSAKKTSTENGYKVDLEAQLEESSGYSALWGGNADIGVGGSANLDITKNNSKGHVNSTITSNGNINIKSGADTNLKGAVVDAKKDINVNVGGNLNIESQKSSYDENSINANAGGNVSVGGSSNTIGKGELGFNAGGGNIWKSGETVEQSGIKAGGNLNVNVEGDANIIGGVLGSETGEGSLNVGGNLNVKDIVTSEKQGGSHITVSGGFTGDMGVDGTIGDTQDKQVISKGTIGLNSDNINVKGDISVNGDKSSADNINSDMKNSQTIDKDIFTKGGDITMSGAVSNVKDIKDKFTGSKGSYTVNKDNTEENIKSDIKNAGITPDVKEALGTLDKVIEDAEDFLNTSVSPTEKNLDKTLNNQKKLADKESLTEQDKNNLNKLEQELKNQTEQLKNEIIEAKKDELKDKIQKIEKEILDKTEEVEKLMKKEQQVLGDSQAQNGNGDVTIPSVNNNSENGAENENKISVSEESIHDEIDFNNKSDSEESIYDEIDFGTKPQSQRENNITDSIEAVKEKLENKMQALLGKQEQLSAKNKLSETDKLFADAIEKELRDAADKLNEITRQETIKQDMESDYVEPADVIKQDQEQNSEYSPLDIYTEVNKKGTEPIYAKVNKDKYKVLDKDNPFDFPQDNGERVQINDTANEKTIIPQYYRPLDAISPKYTQSDNSQKGILKGTLENKISNLLDQQKKLADKQNLTTKDKAQLNILEKQLKEALGQLNDTILFGNKKIDSKNKKISFSGDVNVKYIDNGSLKLEDGGKEKINDYFEADNTVDEALKYEIPSADYTDGSITLPPPPSYPAPEAPMYEIPPVDYGTENVRLEIPEPDYNTDSMRPEIPEPDYNVNGVRPEIPEPDYNVNGVRPEIPEPDYKVKKSVSFDNKVNVKYIDKNSIKLVEGGKEEIKDKNENEEFVIKYHYPPNNGKQSSENNIRKAQDTLTNDQNSVEIPSIKKYEDTLDEILSKQQKLADSPDKYGNASEKLEKSFKKLLEDMNSDVQENGDVNIPQDVITRFTEKFNQYQKMKEEKFSGEPQKEENLDEELKMITRSEKDVRKNLESVAKEADKIPKEHLLDYLQNILKNTHFEQQSDYVKGEKDVILKNPRLKNDVVTEGNLQKIYDAVVKDENEEIRKILDEDLIDRLIEDKEFGKLLSENKLTEENVQKLFDIIQSNKKEIYEELLEDEFVELPLKVLPPHENQDILGVNTGKEVKVFMNPDRNLQEVFETLVHEMVHQDQNSMLYATNGETGNLPLIYYLNSSPGGYLKQGDMYYDKQPVEKEAFESAEKIVKAVLDKVLKDESVNTQDIYVNSDNESSDSDSEEEMDFASFVKSQFSKNKDKSVKNNADKELLSKTTDRKPVPEYRNPPGYEEQAQKLAENSKKLQSEIDTISKDLNRLNKVKSITGGDLGLESMIENLKEQLENKKEELNNIDKKTLAGIPKENQDRFKNLAEELNNLVVQQEKISNKGVLSSDDLAQLDNIENNMKEVLNNMKKLKIEKPESPVISAPQDVTIKLLPQLQNQSNEDNDVDDFTDNDSIWEGRAEERIEMLLEQQKNISDKGILSKNDKKKLGEIESQLKDLVDEINSNSKKK